MKISEVDNVSLWKVPACQAFEWVKSGLWNKAIFLRWVESIKEHQEFLTLFGLNDE